MPRLTTQQYLAIHAELHRHWVTRIQLKLMYLSPKDQWALHDCFRLSEDLTEAELVAHRKAITKKRPELPHAAGRAWKRYNQPRPMPVYAARKRGAPLHLTARPVVRPTIDVKRLAQALLDLARVDARRENEQQDKDASG